jgi:glycosyltransferase A (GT-A) superfamily protein (DUF2064 family)
MSQKKKSTDARRSKEVIVICVQEPFEEGTAIDFGPIHDDDVRILHQAFITDTITQGLRFSDVDIRLYHIDQPDRTRLLSIIIEYLRKKLTGNLADRFKNQFATIAQDNERLGIRLEHAFKDCFDSGYETVLLVGSRTPTVTTDMFKAAMKMLSESDAIFGPTPDGRYYSIGMAGAYKIELSTFDWKSPSIYSEVATAFSDNDLHWSELPIWYSVDSTEDLEFMARDINQFRFEGDTTTARETELAMERILAKLS